MLTLLACYFLDTPSVFSLHGVYLNISWRFFKGDLLLLFVDIAELLLQDFPVIFHKINWFPFLIRSPPICVVEVLKLLQGTKNSCNHIDCVPYASLSVAV